MEPVTTINGTMAPLPRADVDTDQIIPKQFLKRIERTGFGPYLFYDWGRDAEGEPDPGFVLNQPQYRDATVLVSGPNFGSGSSREHAPWAIQDRGFAAVVAPSFADIFRNNCHKNGLLPIELSSAEVTTLTEMATADPYVTVTIDLNAQTVTAPGFAAEFTIDPNVKHRLLHGLDDIALTLEHEGEIDAFEGSRPAVKPVVT
jgi:3-isopropylmalate/(R)-2-methylmalate dehydratase small subunit